MHSTWPQAASAEPNWTASMDELKLSIAIEDLLVQRNLRGMQQVQAVLEPGYYLRAAQHLRNISGTVLIGTGFPVADTFETAWMNTKHLDIGHYGVMGLLIKRGRRRVSLSCYKAAAKRCQVAHWVHLESVGVGAVRDATSPRKPMDHQAAGTVKLYLDTEQKIRTRRDRRIDAPEGGEFVRSPSHQGVGTKTGLDIRRERRRSVCDGW